MRIVMRTLRPLLLSCCGLLLGTALAGELAVPPAFTRNPVAAKAGDKVKVDFAVSRECDVAVFIEDANGRVIRHLVSGVLGKNPPPPLKANSLEQSIEWDGKDDVGKFAAGGPFKVRVGLGLKPTFDRIINANPEAVSSVRALAVGPKGEVFAFFCFGTVHPSDNSMACAVFSRDGKYLRTIMPYPANLPDDKLKGLKRLELENGVKAPYIYHMENRSFVPSAGDLFNHRAIATRDGRVAFCGVMETPHRYGGPGPAHMVAINTDGSVPEGGPVRALINPKGYSASLALSPDEKTIYASGMLLRAGKAETVDTVYRFGWDDKEAKPFLGGKDAAGDAKFSSPVGIATDKDGNVYVADKGNDRVAAFKPDGSFLGAIKVSRPELVEVHPRTGAVYVLGGAGVNELSKFASFKADRPTASTTVPNFKHESYTAIMALDGSADPAVLWLGSQFGFYVKFTLLRIEDQGDSFGKPVDMAGLPESKRSSGGTVLDVSLDRPRELVYVGWDGAFDGRTGERKGNAPPRPLKTDAEGVVFATGLDGLLYMQSKIPMGFRRYDPATLRPVPFGDTETVLQPSSLRLRGRGITADAQGNIYHLWQKLKDDLSPGDQADADALGKWGPDGKVVNAKLIDSDIRSLNSPCTDYAGNIYLLVGLRPGKEQLPPGLKGKLPEGEKDTDAVGGLNCYPLVYGSVVKFGPEGGVIRKGSGGVECNYNHNGLTTAVKGAKWIVPGPSNVPSWRTGTPYVKPDICLCESPRFDVDGFGRSFYPDAARFRVGVLDTNGNAICTFGAYGNQDSAGPGSAVPTPEIPFCWVQAVAVGDEAAYVGDRLNRRVVRVKLVYLAEGSIEIK